MKKLVLALSAAILLFASSCGDGTLSAADYNQKAISIYNPLQARMSNIDAVLDGDKAAGQAKVAAMTKSVDSARTEIGKLKPGKDAQELHTSLMALLDYEHDKVMPLLGDMVSKMDNPDELMSAAKNLQAMTSEINTLETKMTTAQQVMAAKAGRKLD